jgi:AcrR family transcriptional regulator
MRKDPKSKRGPKADPGKTRALILDAARAEFGQHGFDGATLRSIAAAANVDVALLPYYFGTKAGLFVAALDLPVTPQTVLRDTFADGVEGAGTRVLRTLLKVWDDPSTGAPLVAMFRSLSTQSELLGHLIEDQLVGIVTDAIKGPRKRLRAAAFTSQVLGLVLERYVLRVEPLASAGHEEIVQMIGPALQGYLG